MRSLFQHVLPSILILALIASQVEAREWTIIGPRALGMGGAHVAFVKDSTASYWNPAAYGFFKTNEKGYYGKTGWSSVSYAGVDAQSHEDFAEMLDNVLDYDFEAFEKDQILGDNLTEFFQLVDDLKSFNENNRVGIVTIHAGQAGQIGNFGMGSYVFGELSGCGRADLVNIVPESNDITVSAFLTQLLVISNSTDGPSVPAGDYYFDSSTKNNLTKTIADMPVWNAATAASYVQVVDYILDQAQQNGEIVASDITNMVSDVAQLAVNAQNGGSFANNETELLFKGIIITEFPLTYGLSITNDFAIGGNIKLMNARVYNASVSIFEDELGEVVADALENSLDYYEESQNIGLDFGLLYRFGDEFRVGVVGRNLNSPKFVTKKLPLWNHTTIKEEPQVRAGIAYSPFRSLSVALDLDLTKNKITVYNDYVSQNIGGGVEFNLFKGLNLRGGAFKNLEEKDIGLVYTAGIGMNLRSLSFDIGASIGSGNNKIEGTEYPEEAKVELALSVLF